MKLFNLIFTLLFLTFNAVADPIECYWIKATVTTSDNKAYKGYFHVNSKEIQINHDDLGYFYIQNNKYDLPEISPFQIINQQITANKKQTIISYFLIILI
jgi:hypothetical protein